MATSEIIQIDAEGDVVLVCGPEGEQMNRRVASAILNRASAVFKNLVSQKYKDGNELSQKGFVEITAPDDSGTDMQILLNILHHRNNLVPDDMNSSRILDMAMLTDKYDCMFAMKYVSQVWFQPYMSKQLDIATLSDLLVAAYYFQNQSAFDNLCESMIWRSVGSITWDPAIRNSLIKLHEYLDQQRTKALRHLQEAIESRIELFVSNRCMRTACEGTKGILVIFLAELMAHGLFGGSKRAMKPLDDLVTELKKFECTVSAGSLERNYCHWPECVKAKNGTVKTLDLKGIAEGIRLLVHVPCFRCVKEAGIGPIQKCTHR